MAIRSASGRATKACPMDPPPLSHGSKLAAKDGFLHPVAAFVGFAPVVYEFVYETTFRSIFACQITTGIGSTKVLLGELVSERLSAPSGE